MILPVWMRPLRATAVLSGFCLVLAGGASAQETAESASQRPVAPIPAVAPSLTSVAAGLPKWSEFPVPPSDVPTVADIAARVKTQAIASTQLAAEVRALVWDNDEPESFAAAAIARINPIYLKPVDAVLSVEQIERLADDLRRRAVAPPMAD
ncbi:hypothetical protein [Asticcacaulis sp. AC402]|uniref:hypothetical protein n=1 Tax=Asticcacaulis sp. AC402 TaxID=1282361 RepID=UPI0012DC639D|nr:hypothetical protein [Asticcacaulis sp. AC402]